MQGPDWSIQDIARMAGTTSRTLRHYDDVGLVKPSRIGGNGYRYYDADALVRLQRVLLLRELGLGIPAIGEVLAGQSDDTLALRTHLEWLAQEKERIGRQIASVERTITELEGGETRSTRTRSSSAGARTRTRRATHGGTRSRRRRRTTSPSRRRSESSRGRRWSRPGRRSTATRRKHSRGITTSG